MTFSSESLENPQKIRHLEPKCHITENKKNMAFDDTHVLLKKENMYHSNISLGFKVETPYHDNYLILTPIISPQSGWQ